jgi:hypothetical protein
MALVEDVILALPAAGQLNIFELQERVAVCEREAVLEAVAVTLPEAVRVTVAAADLEAVAELVAELVALAVPEFTTKEEIAGTRRRIALLPVSATKMRPEVGSTATPEGFLKLAAVPQPSAYTTIAVLQVNPLH